MIILCFAKFYHRMQIDNVNSFRNLIVPIIILIMPMFLVISQPDLGTTILIALSGIIVIWLSGVNINYFISSFIVLVIANVSVLNVTPSNTENKLFSWRRNK